MHIYSLIRNFIFDHKVISAFISAAISAFFVVPASAFHTWISIELYELTDWWCRTEQRALFLELTTGNHSYPEFVKKISLESGRDRVDLEALVKQEAQFISNLKSLARSDYPEAQFYLAETLAKGLVFLEPNASECKKWMDFAKSRGHPKADLNKC